MHQPIPQPVINLYHKQVHQPCTNLYQTTSDVINGKTDIDTLIVLLYDSEEHYEEKIIQSWNKETAFEKNPCTDI
jgi:hypothetical protein